REAILLQLSHSHHCIGVDLHSGKQVCIAPVISFRGRAAQLDLYALSHQPGEEVSVWVPGFNGMTGWNMTICVIGLVGKHEIGRVSVKNGNNLPFDVPVLEVAGE